MVVRSGAKIQARADRRTCSQYAPLCGSCSDSSRSPFDVSRPSSEAEESRRSSSSRSASSLRYSPKGDAARESRRLIEASWSCCRGSGRDGRISWSSCSPTLWCAGIERVSGSTGARSRSPDLVGLRFQLRCKRSFADLQMRTAGELGRFKPDSRSSESSLGFPRSLDISRREILTAINANAGARSFGITVTALQRWTSSSCPPPGFDCCLPGS